MRPRATSAGWVTAAADGENEGDTQVAFGVDGERMLEEVSLGIPTGALARFGLSALDCHSLSCR